MIDKKLKVFLSAIPGESKLPSVRREALRRLAMDLATQFPAQPELTAIGERLEYLLQDL